MTRKVLTPLLSPAPMIVAVLSVLLAIPRAAQGQGVVILKNFWESQTGLYPESSLTRDSAGNLYGTTAGGGIGTSGYGNGTVYELIAPSVPNAGNWTETILYTFCSLPNCIDGQIEDQLPYLASVIFDSAGNLYGTTTEGGAYGQGVVFELSPVGNGWQETVLYSFCAQTGCPDGAVPMNSLIWDSAGNLYGGTIYGGSTGTGTIFKLSPSTSGWTEQTISATYGTWTAGLAMDSAGNIYGITVDGTVFELSPNGSGGWNSSVIYALGGFWFSGTPVLDPAGNIYLAMSNLNGIAAGVVYKLSQESGVWTKKTLANWADAEGPLGGVILDSAGNVYGTSGGPFNGGGTVFELKAPGYEQTILWNSPYGSCASLLMDSGGNLYGTTNPCLGAAAGDAFMVSPVGATATTLGSSVNPSIYGQSINLSAKVISTANASTPSGTVVFYNGQTEVGSQTLVNGKASLALSNFNKGSYSITAAYQGSSTFHANVSNLLTQTVNSASTTVNLASSLNPANTGQPITYAAAVSGQYGGALTGSVSFYSGGQLLGAVPLAANNTTFLTTTFSAAGSYTITAQYSGDSNNNGNISPVLQQVINSSTTKSVTSTTLISSLNPSIYGQKVTFTAAVINNGGPVPTGKVAFIWGPGGMYTIGTAILNNSGVATLTTSILNADSYPMTAVYYGDANNLGSTSPVVNQVVNEATSSATLTSSPNPAIAGETITFTVRIESPTVTAKGPVTFSAGKTILGTVELDSSKAMLTTTSLPVGSTVVTVTYQGDSNITGSSASVTQVVLEGSAGGS